MRKESILRHLGDHPWASGLTVLDQAASTNTLLKEMARQGAPEGTVLIADRQTAGRGRLGRSFHSPGGVGIYFSVLLRPCCPAHQLMHLTCAAAVAMCNAVQGAAGIRPRIKWINDLVLGEKKLGGILTEMGFDAAGNVEFAVIGAGINCLQQESDFDPAIRSIATSLSINGCQAERSLLAAEMIRASYNLSQSLLGDRGPTMARYKADCLTIGKEVQVIRGDEIRTAKALDVDAEGALIVRYSDNGQTAPVSSGEVSVRGMYGYI